MSDSILPSMGDVIYGPLYCWDLRDRGLAYVVDDIQSIPIKGTILILRLYDPGEHSSDTQYLISSHELSYNGEYWESDAEPRTYHPTPTELDVLSESVRPGEISSDVAVSIGKSLFYGSSKNDKSDNNRV